VRGVNEGTAEAIDHVEFLQPSWLIFSHRAVLALFAVFLAVWTVDVAVERWWPAVAVSPVMFLMWSFHVWVARRFERVAIVADGDTLVVTNTFRVYRIPRDQIVGVSSRRSFRLFTGPHLEVRLRDGTSVWPDLVLRDARTSSAVYETCREGLNRWLRR
jgi:hypothetical protein